MQRLKILILEVYLENYAHKGIGEHLLYISIVKMMVEFFIYGLKNPRHCYKLLGSNVLNK